MHSVATPTASAGAGASSRKPIQISHFGECQARDEKIALLTAYDATFAAAADAAGIDGILVGDSLGMVCQGLPHTVSVTLDAMCIHTENVSRGLRRVQGRAWLMADLPFGSYHGSLDQAMCSAAALMRAGAQMVKLEGGGWTAEVVRFLTERGVPVCAHLGLTPQSVHAQGGYRVQGRSDDASARIEQDALALQDAGARLMVLEMVPAVLAERLTRALERCPTIGIGAGRATAGQVLVMHDVLGIGLGARPRFTHDFLQSRGGIVAAFQGYVRAVKDGSFPVDALHAW